MKYIDKSRERKKYVEVSMPIKEKIIKLDHL